LKLYLHFRGPSEGAQELLRIPGMLASLPIHDSSSTGFNSLRRVRHD
jgi:hypothetical protein